MLGRRGQVTVMHRSTRDGKPNRTIKEAHWLFWWEGGSNNEKLNNVRKMV